VKGDLKPDPVFYLCPLKINIAAMMRALWEAKIFAITTSILE
jgi:hypothetical protein